MDIRNRLTREIVVRIIVVTAFLLCITTMVLVISMVSDGKAKEVETTEQVISPYIYEPMKQAIFEEIDESEIFSITEEEIEEPEKFSITEEEIDLIALVTMAEAEGECEEGKRLVIDTILNRVDSIYWPDTVIEVIYQPHQFTSMWNGRVERCYVTDEIRQLVKEELVSRTNYDVVFFTAGRYGKYGKPMFQVGNHYFSSYN